MVVAFDPQATTVLVAYCDYERSKVSGVFPATAADYNGRSPSTYTHRHERQGIGFVDTASCPSYFNVEWLPVEQVSYTPPDDPKQRKPKVNEAYEPLDAVLRGVPALTDELWEVKARLYGEQGDDNALFSLVGVRGRLGLSHKWFYRGSYWERSVMLPTTNPKYPMSGRLLVEREPHHRGWVWSVNANAGATSRKPYRHGNAKFAIEGMAMAESALLTVQSKETPIPPTKTPQGQTPPDDLPF